MKETKDFLRGFILPFAIGALAVSSIAAVYNIYAGDRFDLTSSGTRKFAVEVDSGGDARVVNSGGINKEVLSLRNSTGGLKLVAYTDTQIKTLTPDTTGELIWSSTQNNVCISTGSGGLKIGAYVILSDFSTKCYGAG